MQEHTVEIERFKVKIVKTISEGGFGIVYLVETDSKPPQRLALKKIITQDEERYEIAVKELNFLKTYCSKPNPHFINYYASKIVKEDSSKHSFYILIEFGQNGTLFDLMAIYMQKNQRFSEDEILTILRTINEDLTVMHAFGMIHCDFKIENLLFFNWETIKLCDFGSVDNYNLDFSTIQKQQFYFYESAFEKQTTLMYRPPEMCDLYLGYKVNTKIDMWMLGCVLFTLMFFKHPFNESSKLAIVSASFFWPVDSQYSEKLENLVRNLLTPEPSLRPSASDIKNFLNNWENLPGIELNHMARSIKMESQLKRGNLAANSNRKSPRNRQQIPDNIFEEGFIDMQPVQKKAGFDFSGLNRLSKKPQEQFSQQNQKRGSEKLGNFSFMNLEFKAGSTLMENNAPNFFEEQSKPRASIENNVLGNFSEFDAFNKEENEYETNLQADLPQNKTKDFDAFDIDFS